MYKYYIKTIEYDNGVEKALNKYLNENPNEELVNVISVKYNNGFPYIQICTKEKMKEMK